VETLAKSLTLLHFYWRQRERLPHPRPKVDCRLAQAFSDRNAPLASFSGTFVASQARLRL
jgi:hypothetical protein